MVKMQCLYQRDINVIIWLSIMSLGYMFFWSKKYPKDTLYPKGTLYPKVTLKALLIQIKTFLDKQLTVDSGTTSERQKTLHYSLPYIGHFTHVTKKKWKHICERFCKDIDINIAFSSLKVSIFFSCKDTLPISF